MVQVQVAPAPEVIEMAPKRSSRGSKSLVPGGDRRTSELGASAPGAWVYKMRWKAREIFLRSGWYESGAASSMRKFLRGNLFTVVAMISVFIALFLGEMFSAAQVPGNTALDVITTFVFAIFLFEWLGLSITDTSYLLGFFFWMDFVGTISMVFDISYLAGPDVTEPDMITKNGDSASTNVIVVRATRAAKIGARAGRISRVLKILRFLPFLLNSQQDTKKVKMAKVISNQLTNVLSTRVAFLTICIVVVLPLFTMFTYPEEDESMAVWSELLALNAQVFSDAVAASSQSEMNSAKDHLVSELSRFREFYSSAAYGPYKVTYGNRAGNGDFVVLSDELDLSGSVDWTFAEPQRLSSSRIVTTDRIQAFFNLAYPRRQEAFSNLGLICFIILVMCVFGMLMSSSISVIALQPLERMLSVVRERCAQIFKYTDNLKEEESDESSEESDEEYDDMEADSEFVLLEKVVTKLAGIAQVSTTKQEPEVKENMTENDVMVLNWMQGAVNKRTETKVQARQSMAPGKGLKLPSQLGISEDEDASVENVRGTINASLLPSIVESLDGPDFSSLDLTKENRIAVASYLICDSEHAWSYWAHENVNMKNLSAFLIECEANYPPNPFHNFSHALDVEYTVARYMDLMNADSFLSEYLEFSLLISSLGHDLGHTGVNNQYLIETSDELAVRYNDRSPLENMHCAKLFQILSNPSTNVYSQIDRDLYKEIRKGMIDAILHTDVTKHNEMIKELGMLYQMNSGVFDTLQPEIAIASHSQVELIASMLLHGADIGNPVKPWELCRRLAYLCVDEFFAQGDLEKAAGLPVQMLNDRDKVNRANAQVGFIEFFIAPMTTEMVHLFPPLYGLGDFLGGNIAKWCDVWAEETAPAPDALAKVTARVKKVGDHMKILTTAAREYCENAPARSSGFEG